MDNKIENVSQISEKGEGGYDNGCEDSSIHKIKYIDLCAGTGAFSYVLSEFSNYECVFANDMVMESKQIYNINYINKHKYKHSDTKESPFVLGDLHKIEINDIPDHDLLCMGFSCQSYSIAGKRLGFKDKRADIFWKFIDIIKYHNPRYIILENVKNLLSHDKGKTFDIMKKNISDCGYYIRYNVLDTAKITGIPQHRERIYIVCFRNEYDYKKFNMPSNEDNSVQKRNIDDFLETTVPSKYYYTDRYKVYNAVKNGVKEHVSKNKIYQYRRHYIRENKNGVCPTLTKNMGSGGHNVPLIKDNNGIRKLTPRECFSLQGFPTKYIFPNGISDSKLYQLAGNAVSLPVVRKIIYELNQI